MTEFASTVLSVLRYGGVTPTPVKDSSTIKLKGKKMRLIQFKSVGSMVDDRRIFINPEHVSSVHTYHDHDYEGVTIHVYGSAYVFNVMGTVDSVIEALFKPQVMGG